MRKFTERLKDIKQSTRLGLFGSISIFTFLLLLLIIIEFTIVKLITITITSILIFFWIKKDIDYRSKLQIYDYEVQTKLADDIINILNKDK